MQDSPHAIPIHCTPATSQKSRNRHQETPQGLTANAHETSAWVRSELWRNERIGGWEKDSAEGFRVPEFRASVHGKGSVRIGDAVSRWVVKEGAVEEEESFGETPHIIQVIVFKSKTIISDELFLNVYDVLPWNLYFGDISNNIMKTCVKIKIKLEISLYYLNVARGQMMNAFRTIWRNQYEGKLSCSSGHVCTMIMAEEEEDQNAYNLLLW